MSSAINATHDPNLRSWVESANQPDTDFPIQNLPLGVFRRRNSTEYPRLGVAIGDQILDLLQCHERGLLEGLPGDLQAACVDSNLNALMALGNQSASALRQRLSQLLRSPQQNESVTPDLLLPMSDAEMLLPAAIADYTDFYASVFHATNVGKLFRPDNPLLPNYKYVPIAYHGRASSIVVSGTPIKRPNGQRKPPDATVPSFGPSQMLDYEMEVGALIGVGNELGEAIAIDQAEDYLFGLCLVNDWSARDIQAWEYQPLGPFLAKNFATSISPWVVTLEALAPFRGSAFPRAEGDPEPLPYLSSERDRQQGGIDLTVEVLLCSAQMRAAGMEPIQVSRGSLQQMYWTLAQMLTHHASNGCNLRPADLIASGTISGPEPGSQGCLLEITQRGAHPIELPTGEVRSFLVDGDEVILRGYCEKPGYARIGLGTCQGIVTG
ncbi:MAG: fumarylacetoacetase [Trichocoleus desertorum ATA4-8-CV12]|nr:fumarylacetoacetase [Trichocoleus desertorum ATA4-8-CV12]